MKKNLQRLYVLAGTLMLAAYAFNASAEIEIKEVNDYFEGFDNVATGKDQLAIGWHRIPDITNLGTIDTYRVEGIGGMDDDRSVNSQVFSVQYQETWDDETGVSYKTDDLILTPEVKGHVEFWLKYKGRPETYNTWPPSVNIYRCTDNGDFTYTKGAEITIAPVSIATNSWVKVELDVEDWTILGLRLENVYFDSFSADVARVPQVQFLQLTMFQSVSGSTVYADESGNASINLKVRVTNRGNLPIAKEQEDFTIELQNGMEPVATHPIGVDMQPGDVIDFEFTQPWKLKKLTEAETLNLQCVENISRHASSTSITVKVEVFAPILNVTLDGVDVKDGIDLGVFGSRRELTLDFVNLGGKELNVTSLTCVGSGMSIATGTPFTVEPYGSVPVKVILESDGAVAGNIEIESDGIATTPAKLHYYGAGVADNICRATFDGLKLPARWFLDKKDAWTTNNRMGEALRSATSSSSTGKLISPLMSFDEGGKITMSLGRWATWTESWLKVYVSDDRVNWTEIAKVSSSDENNLFPDTQWEFAAYELPVSAGNKYIAVEGLYANIDNLTGGVLAEVDNDVYIHDFTSDIEGMVNYPMNATLTVRNLGYRTLEASDYKVEVFVNGDKVGEASELQELSNDAEKASEIKVSFTPHKAMENGKIKARISVGEYIVESAEAEVVIKPEAIDATKVVGTFNADRSGSNIPMRTGDYNSYSEFIYTAGQLGLEEGDRITKIAFPYTILADRTADKNVRVWMQCTDTERMLRPDAGKAFDVTDMLQVSELTLTLTKTVPSGIFGNYALLEIPFDREFLYDGRNLRVIVETTSSAFIASEFLNFTGGNTVFTSSDNPINVKNVTPDFLMALPVAVFTLDKGAVSVTGTVTDGNNALAGIPVRFTAGDVLYESITAEDGTFNVGIMQPALSYTTTVAAHGFKDMQIAAAPYVSDTDLGSLIMNENVVDQSSVSVITDEMEETAVDVSWQPVVPGSLDTSVAYDIYLDGERIETAFEATEYSIEALTAGLHTVGIAAVFAPEGVTTTPAEAEFTVRTSLLDGLVSDGITVTGAEGRVDISLPAGADVHIYSINGALLMSARCTASVESVRLASGVYVVRVDTGSEAVSFKAVVK